VNLVNLCCRKRSVAEFMQESIAFLLRVQCRRKESSRCWLSHLLMSFLLVSVLLCRNVLLYFWATVSALVCLVCSSTVVRNYDDDDDDHTTNFQQVSD